MGSGGVGKWEERGWGGATAVIDKRPVVVTHILPNTSAPELLHSGAAGRHARLAALLSPPLPCFSSALTR